ncbi:MAG: thymidylate kinase [Desulfuromonadales bacterium]|nr:thymidylate kinase [Desulfuromonadales bacterium]
MRKGKLIVVEGINGSGPRARSAIVALHKALTELKYEVVECANPDSSRAKELGIKDFLGWPFGEDYRGDMFFESAVRSQIFRNVVVPALEKDKIVICKQSSISSLANAWVHGYDRHFDTLRLLEKMSRGFLFEDEIYPDMTIFIDVPVEEAFEYIEEVMQIHHEGGIEYFKKMREFYLGEMMRWRGVRIEAGASRSEDDINAEILGKVKQLLKVT